MFEICFFENINSVCTIYMLNLEFRRYCWVFSLCLMVKQKVNIKYLIIVLLFNLLTISSVCQAQGELDKLKAAFLLNFAKYVDWPQNVTDNLEDKFTFCIVSHKEQFVDYKLLEQKSLNKRAIIVEHTDSPEKANNCQVVFLMDGRGQDIGDEVLKLIDKKPILSVSDAIDGGMIYLFEDNGRIKFNINLVNAHASGLNFSSQMLKLANNVED